MKEIIISSHVIRKAFDEVKEHVLNQINKEEHTSWYDGLDDDTKAFVYLLTLYKVQNMMERK